MVMIFLESCYSKNFKSAINRFANPETKATPRTGECGPVLFGIQGNK